MAQQLRGAPAAQALDEKTRETAERLKAEGICPTLALLRAGARAEDLSYEKNIRKRCEKTGVRVLLTELAENTEPKRFYEELRRLAADPEVHGILLFRPFPPQINDAFARGLLPPEKDVDGCTELSLAGVFTGTGRGFAPCTAEAVTELLRFYGIGLRGKHAVVFGRSLVVGKPLAQLLLAADATVTVCHTKTEHPERLTRGAELILTACGRPGLIGREHLTEGQILVDAGIAWDESAKRLRGDIDEAAAEEKALAYTPVPGGIGAVTTAVLARHTVLAAERAAR